MKNKKTKYFDYILGAEILKDLRNKVNMKHKNEISTEDKDVIIIPSNNSSKLKSKSLNREK